ncbi:hypothetical protein LTR78_004986 [Recurvomyces mirabilis]|uniref:Mus7/MMS22 family-domain-containing protein n=1 Tax=Recurvomyces mirabilis TaxID=574656 RepID=A0AAE0WNN3_9PEZI|nr:hypothetical protein LTR78_004986 [Recurvomyces mirabilis]KAK5158398.1 hypothetical protein LTS14_003416 [Recurvomyces mirabilis]
MKRWQDRGEVQDSDDEDLSLGGGGESQSPQQARKRPRLSHRGSSLGDDKTSAGAHGVGGGGNEEADVPWLAPAHATAYGKRSRPSDASAPRREALFVAIPAVSLNATAQRHYDQSGDHPLSGDLPDPSQLIAGRSNVAPTTPTCAHETSGSLRSSPLSELGDTPRSSPGLFSHVAFKQSAHDSVPVQVELPDARPSDDPLLDLAELLEEQPTIAVGRGRTFRARTEKQLHPYGWDKTLYQQQWKQRGLKPIRVIDQRVAETRDQSYSSDESDSQQQPLFSSSPVQSSPTLIDQDASAANHHGFSSPNVEDDFPDIDQILRKHMPGVVTSGRKRRKTAHLNNGPNAIRAPSIVRDCADADAQGLDIYSIPPSPPPTSSGSQSLPKQRDKPAVFRLPPGATPAPLPTPQVSSDVHRHRQAADGDYDLDEVPQSRTSRPSTISRARTRPLMIDSSTESEEDQDVQAILVREPEVDERRLIRERKRIKGVLPASWLKIDFKAQHRQRPQTPTRARRASTPPTADGGRLKGVAQRVSRISSTARQPQSLIISDDEDEFSSLGTSNGEGLRSPRTDAERPWSALLQADADDTRMEGDWVDPMLAGSTRNAPRQRKPKRRQPRIADAFLRAGGVTTDVQEERATSRRNKPSSRLTVSGSRSGAATAGASRRSRAPRLSVLDMPSPPSDSDNPIPQFIRLAQRRAKQQTGCARHSPSSKVIRLATAEDTADAETTLTAWREGTIAPRTSPASATYKPRLTADVQADIEGPRIERSRLPLVDVTNYYQQRLPLSLRGRTSSTDRHEGVPRTQPSLRKRQTHINTVVVRRVDHQESDNHTKQQEPGPSDSAHDPRRTSRPMATKAHYRGGQLESLESAYDHAHRAAAFERRIATLTETIARGRQGTWQPMDNVEHYLRHDMTLQPIPKRHHAARRNDVPATTQPVQSIQPLPAGDRQAIIRSAQPAQQLPHRPRKRWPQHVDIEARLFRQPSEPLPDTSTSEAVSITGDGIDDGLQLKGLGPFGTRYSTDFDVNPLPLGTFFHSSTFIGSGDFAASLKLGQRDLSVITGRIYVHVAEKVLAWEAWTEEIAAGLSEISKVVAEALQSLEPSTAIGNVTGQMDVIAANIDHMLRSVIRYISKCLAFLDAIDRRSCIQSLYNFVELLLESVSCWPQTSPDLLKLQTRVSQYVFVIAHQVYQLAHHDLVSLNTQQACRRLLTRAADDLVRSVFPAGFQELRSIYEDNRSSSKREAGIRDDGAPISTVTLLRHCLTSDQPAQSSLWSTLFRTQQSRTSTLDSVSTLDCMWYDLFTILPALEMDNTGVAIPGRRFSANEHDWTLPKILLSRLLELYPSASAITNVGINDYLRATLSRCYLLIDRWGWWRCESILSVMFDFFARRNLGPLLREQHAGSPYFLQELDSHPSLEVQPTDRPFHIFLKTVVTGLRHMQKPGNYSDKKIGGIVWRFIPSHGRTYPKDADVQGAEIEALRNHQDLLCVLYNAAPSGCRPRVDLLKNLVDHAQSHREACRLNVRAWANLIRFQLSCGEPEEAMQPFTTWYEDIVQATMAQFRLARTEAESDYAAACAEGNNGVTQSTLESVIATNQRRIVATLVDALAGLKRALQTAKTTSTVICLIQGTSFWNVLMPFDTSEKRLLPALDEALEVVKAALDTQHSLVVSNESQNASEESQDFGDSSALDEMIGNEHRCSNSAPDSAIFNILHDPVRQLLSTLFGADVALDELILGKIVDTWVRLASVAVKSLQATWTDFVGEYYADSWQQLRSTEQRRRFTPYFYARVVERSPVGATEVYDIAFGVLLVSLVEREAILKYQHLLLNALLNHASDHPVLNNLPFMRHARNGQSDTSLSELRQRRLALLSCLLSNMRQCFDDTVYEHPGQVQQVRKQYGNYLRLLMQAMKANFMELQGGSNIDFADPHAQGAYVDFVQHVVSYLQEYTTDICRIDDFFIDSSAFPLPATDPMYVVGRLRSYGPKLRDAKPRKELTVFVQTVVERAIVDGHQTYLVEQLCTAMDTGVERGSKVVPSLRFVLLDAILSLYLDTALDTACSWLLSSPILAVYGTVASSLTYNLDLRDQSSIQAVVQITSTMLRNIRVPLQQALTHPGLLSLPHVQRVLALVFDNVRHVQTLCQYLCRRSPVNDNFAQAMEEIHKAAVEIYRRLSGSEDEWYGFEPSTESTGRIWWPDTREFAQRQLRESLCNSWHARDGQYFVQRGKMQKEVVALLDDEEGEKKALTAKIENFCQSFEAIYGGRWQHSRSNGGSGQGQDGLVV